MSDFFLDILLLQMAKHRFALADEHAADAEVAQQHATWRFLGKKTPRSEAAWAGHLVGPPGRAAWSGHLVGPPGRGPFSRLVLCRLPRDSFNRREIVSQSFLPLFRWGR